MAIEKLFWLGCGRQGKLQDVRTRLAAKSMQHPSCSEKSRAVILWGHFLLHFVIFYFCCNEIWLVLPRERQLCVMPTVLCCCCFLSVNDVLYPGTPALQCCIRWCCWWWAVWSSRRPEVWFLSLVWLLICSWPCHKEFPGGGDGSNSFAICNICGASVFPFTNQDLLSWPSTEHVNTYRREVWYRCVALMPAVRTVCGSDCRIFIPLKKSPKRFL